MDAAQTKAEFQASRTMVQNALNQNERWVVSFQKAVFGSRFSCFWRYVRARRETSANFPEKFCNRWEKRCRFTN